MNQAQLYRPSAKWPFVIAFTAAALIHLSAVAFGSLHRETPARLPDAEMPVLGFEPPVESPPILELEPAVPSVPSIDEPDFVEIPPTPRPVIKRPAAGPIRPSPEFGLVTSGNFKANVLSAPRPEYPYEARRRHLTGAGVAIVSVDPSSGAAVDARMEQSTGDPILDHSAVSGFRRWRFKAGTPPTVRIPVVFTLSGASL